MRWLNGDRMRLVVVGVVVTIVFCSGQLVKADLTMDAVRAEDIPKSGKGVSFSRDGLRLYITTNSDILPGGYGNRDIWVAERESPNAPWGEPVNLGPNVNTGNMEGWPAISPDELELHFGVDDGNKWYAMRSTRASKNDPWGPAAEYTGVFPADFSADGLTKFSYGSGGGGYGGQDIWATTRATIDDDWGDPLNLGPNVNNSDIQSSPTISNDDLALFFVNRPPYRLHMCVRATKDDPWGPAVDVGSPVNGSWWVVWPEISPDGSTLYCNRGGGNGFTQVSIKPFVDFINDGKIDLSDLSAMIDYWGTDHSLYDIGPMPWGDGVVDESDLEVLMSYYGQAVDYPAEMVIDVTPPHNPQPADGYTADAEAALPIPISWTPGDAATAHDLYFGTDRVAVENADISDTSGVYRGLQSNNSYTPPEGVQSDQTYYWRLDEVRPTGIAKKGEIWSFTVADYLILDNFESYNDEVDEETFEGPTIWNTWIDGWFTGTSGAIVGYYNSPFAETITVHSGFQAMPFFYDNDGTILEGDAEYERSGVPYYSETQRTWAEPQDWTRKEVEVLSLWFYGDPGNAVERFYVALEDSAGNRKEVAHPDPAAITVERWEQWAIPLVDFTGVDPATIKMMGIGVGDPVSNQPGGTGLVRVDDIELHRSSGQ